MKSKESICVSGLCTKVLLYALRCTLCVLAPTYEHVMRNG